jgi:hypothetical protein
MEYEESGGSSLGLEPQRRQDLEQEVGRACRRLRELSSQLRRSEDDSGLQSDCDESMLVLNNTSESEVSFIYPFFIGPRKLGSSCFNVFDFNNRSLISLCPGPTTTCKDFDDLFILSCCYCSFGAALTRYSLPDSRYSIRWSSKRFQPVVQRKIFTIQLFLSELPRITQNYAFDFTDGEHMANTSNDATDYS